MTNANEYENALTPALSRRTRRGRNVLLEWLEKRRLFAVLTGALQWEAAADAPLIRAEGSKAVVNDKLYTMGGFIGGTKLTVTKELDVFDPATNTWSRLADMPVPETHGGTAVVGDQIWVAGFFYNDGITASKLVYMYDVDTNAWTQEPSLPAGRGAVGMAAIGSIIHVWGGLTGQTTSASDHWSMDVDNLSAGWTTDAPLPQELDHVGGVSLDGKLWSLGGFVDKNETNGNLADVYSYDPATNEWTTQPSLPEGLGHIGPDTTVVGDQIVIAGGQVDASYEKEITNVFDYDPSTGNTTQLTALPLARKSAFCGFADGVLIVSCGNQPNAPYLSNKTWTAALNLNSGGTGGGGDSGGNADGNTGGVTGGTTGGTGGVGSSGGNGSSGTGGTTAPKAPPPLATNPEGPDLSGTVRLSLPRNLIAGERGVAIVSIGNSGKPAAIGPMDVALVLSTDGVNGLAEIGSRVGLMIRLKSGRTESSRIPFTLPAGLAGGNYSVLAQIDSGNVFVESNELNNTAVSSAFAVAARSIVVDETISTSAVVRAGKAAVLRVVLTNHGNVATSGMLELMVSATSSVDGRTQPMLSTQQKISIAAGRNRVVRLPAHTGSSWAGAFQLQVQCVSTSVTDSLANWTTIGSAMITVN